MISSRLLLATLVVIAVILHGSLYPYDFHVPPGGIGPVPALLATWRDFPDGFGDVVANILFYIPLGFFAARTINAGGFARFFIATIVGSLLSTSMELTQYYDVGRDETLSDVFSNTIGTALGAFAALAFGDIERRLLIARAAASPVPLLLLAAMLGYHLFPYVPTIDLHKYWVALRPLIIAPRASSIDVLRYAALWLTASYLIVATIGVGHSRRAVPLFMAGVFAGKVAIVDLIVTPSEVIGAALALVAWLVIGRRPRLFVLFTAAALCISVAVGRLQPFQFTAAARPFGWLPFRGFLDGSMIVNTMACLEKTFLYGSLIWLGSIAGLRLWLSTALVTLLLLATSIAETHLPGRSAEITDALMASIIGSVIAPLRRKNP